MHFSVEKSGKEVGSAQRFSHLKCIEFITYSQTTAATPAPPIATLAPYLFPGETFPMPSRCCFDPPPLFDILHCQQGAESGDDGTRYRIPLSITFHRFRIESCFIAPCYGSFLRPVYSPSRCCSTSWEKFLEVQVICGNCANWYFFENVTQEMERNTCYDDNILYFE